MAPNPIPLSEIVAWLDLNEFNGPFERRWYVAMIRVMDAEWLRLTTEASERKRKTDQARQNARSSAQHRRP